MTETEGALLAVFIGGGAMSFAVFLAMIWCIITLIKKARKT